MDTKPPNKLFGMGGVGHIILLILQLKLNCASNMALKGHF